MDYTKIEPESIVSHRRTAKIEQIKENKHVSVKKAYFKEENRKHPKNTKNNGLDKNPAIEQTKRIADQRKAKFQQKYYTLDEEKNARVEEYVAAHEAEVEYAPLCAYLKDYCTSLDEADALVRNSK